MQTKADLELLRQIQGKIRQRLMALGVTVEIAEPYEADTVTGEEVGWRQISPTGHSLHFGTETDTDGRECFVSVRDSDGDIANVRFRDGVWYAYLTENEPPEVFEQAFHQHGIMPGYVEHSTEESNGMLWIEGLVRAYLDYVPD